VRCPAEVHHPLCRAALPLMDAFLGRNSLNVCIAGRGNRVQANARGAGSGSDWKSIRWTEADVQYRPARLPFRTANGASLGKGLSAIARARRSWYHPRDRGALERPVLKGVADGLHILKQIRQDWCANGG
jgi:hypothetical protein